MELRFKLAEDEALEALQATASRGWVTFLFILRLALLFLVGIYLIDHGFTVVGWIWLTVSVVIGIAMYQVPRMQVRREIRRAPYAQGEVAYTLNDEGTMAIFSTGRSQLDWRHYTRYKETRNLFLLFFSPTRYTVIPKRVMSPEQIEQLRSLLVARIPAQ